MIAHWDDIEPTEVPARFAPIGGTWQRLGDAAGSVGVGLQRVRASAGQMLTPPHRHSGEEEIVHVLAGAGTLWQDGRTCAIGAGDTITFVVGGPVHTLIAGDDGLDVLVFGERRVAETGILPRTHRAFVGRNAVALEAEHPWVAEARLGLPEGEPGDPPENLRRLEDAPDAFGGVERFLARGLAKRTGLNLFALPPGTEGAPPHVHSAEEELIVVLEGAGLLELWHPAHPEHDRQAEPQETHAIKPGHVVSRPPGTRVPHSVRAGADGLTYLVYGTREPSDVCWYPRSNKVFFRGLGVIGRLELLEYGDGEPS